VQIILNYDSSVASAGTQEAAFKQALTVAVNNLDSLITNDITVNIDVGWGEVNGTPVTGSTLGEAETPSGAGLVTDFYSVVNDLNAITNPSPIQQTAYASLNGITDPSNGSGFNFELYPAQEKALGLLPANGGEIDGYVGFSKTEPFNFGTVETDVTGEFDFIGDAEHELTHVLGRISQQEFNSGAAGVFSLLDLFRYKSPGTLAIGNTGSTYFSLDNGTTDLKNFDPTNGMSGDRADWGHGTIADSFNQFVAAGTVLPLTSVDVDMLNVLGFSIACFAAGTLIETPRRRVPVETLVPGDLIVTLSGVAQPLTWLGHRHIDCLRHPRPWQVWPIRVAPGAFGLGRPCRELYLSPDHAVLVDDVLIPIKHLINGDSIAQVMTDEVTYFHVELASHDVIFAEGLPSESYLDTGDRSSFANGGGAIRLFPDFASRDPAATWAARGCAPLVVTGPQLEAARRWIVAQSPVRLRSCGRRLCR
jgi:Hint domain